MLARTVVTSKVSKCQMTSLKGVDAFLDGVGEGMVGGAQGVGHHLRRRQVRRAFEADGEGMQTGPPGPLLVVALDALGGELGRQGRHHRRVQPAGNQHAVGHVGHQVAVYGVAQGVVQGLGIGGGRLAVSFHGHPVALEVTLRRVVSPLQGVAGRKGAQARADSLEGLHLASDVKGPLVVMAVVEGDDADGIPRHQEVAAVAVHQDKGVHASQVMH